MVKGVRSSDSHSGLCSPSSHLYTECTGELLIAFKKNWQKCPHKPDRPSLFARVCIPLHPSWSSSALLTSARHTCRWQLMPHAPFFPVPESLLRRSLWWGFSSCSSLRWTRSVAYATEYLPRTEFTIIHISPLLLHGEPQQSCLRPWESKEFFLEVNGS